MTKEVTVKRTFKPYPYTGDTMLCLVLSLALVAIVIKPLKDCGMLFWWWMPFCIFNIYYILRGMKEGWAKGDPTNGLVILAGPIPFYFWTMLGAWRTYYTYRKGGYGWTIKKLEAEFLKHDISQGFDFEFPFVHKKPIARYLRMNGLRYEDLLHDDWPHYIKGVRSCCFSICDTKQNMLQREALR